MVEIGCSESKGVDVVSGSIGLHGVGGGGQGAIVVAAVLETSSGAIGAGRAAGHVVTAYEAVLRKHMTSRRGSNMAKKGWRATWRSLVDEERVPEAKQLYGREENKSKRRKRSGRLSRHC